MQMCACLFYSVKTLTKNVQIYNSANCAICCQIKYNKEINHKKHYSIPQLTILSQKVNIYNGAQMELKIKLTKLCVYSIHFTVFGVKRKWD